MINIAQQAPRLLFMRAFASYFDGKPAGLNPSTIIRHTPNFISLREKINTSIMEDYQQAHEYVKVRGRVGG